jgi:hypothetical protein
MSKIFEYTKLNLERTIQGLLTKEGEFIYTDTGSRVPKDKTYSVYYLMDKRKQYFTNIITSKFVRELKRLINFDIYDEYVSLIPVERGIYPSISTPKITDKEYDKGSITRYFIYKINEEKISLMEVSKLDYKKKLKLYAKIKVPWKISGNKASVIASHDEAINILHRFSGTVPSNVFRLQYWKPSTEDLYESDTLEKKINLLKKD